MGKANVSLPYKRCRRKPGDIPPGLKAQPFVEIVTVGIATGGGVFQVTINATGAAR